MSRETAGSVIIRRPADEVFTYLRTYDNEAAWEDFVLEARSEPPGPAVVGTRVHKVRRTPVGQERFTIEVVEMDEANRRWVDVAIDGYLKDTRIEWQVTAVEDGARVEVKVELHGHGLLKSIMPVVRRTGGLARVSRPERLRAHHGVGADPSVHPYPGRRGGTPSLGDAVSASEQLQLKTGGVVIKGGNVFFFHAECLARLTRFAHVGALGPTARRCLKGQYCSENLRAFMARKPACIFLWFKTQSGCCRRFIRLA